MGMTFLTLAVAGTLAGPAALAQRRPDAAWQAARIEEDQHFARVEAALAQAAGERLYRMAVEMWWAQLDAEVEASQARTEKYFAAEAAKEAAKKAKAEGIQEKIIRLERENAELRERLKKAEAAKPAPAK